ncbi:glycosyltransferase [Bowmanella denitrificans]|uniref:glycosyltransferase n=1 Tax=Bowmanella denitrificans TaxID=366582 RepID=UPI001559625E|nr:glycosyltransferase [Bowmanella denitrificans]
MAYRKPKVLHVATDFPDGIERNNTLAVKNLLDETDDRFEHRVLSVVRKKGLEFKIVKSGTLYSIVVPRLPLGILCSTIMLFSALFFYFKKGKEFSEVNVIHAHKLTIDGIFAFVLSKILKKPLLISVRGSTDAKFIKRKFYVRWLYKKIINSAEHVFFVSAWARSSVNKLFSEKYVPDSKFTNLANISRVNMVESNKEGADFLFVGRLDLAKSKGLYRVFEAISKEKKYRLDIFGGATNEAAENIKNEMQRLEISHLCNLRGKADKSVIFSGDYAALVMPSYPETFGMVYVESLLSGIPVISSNRSGIAGYIEPSNYYLEVNEFDTEQIARAMKRIHDDKQRVKANLLQDISSGKLNLFNTCYIKEHYGNVAERAALNSGQ